jgi:hypothetical protein
MLANGAVNGGDETALVVTVVSAPRRVLPRAIIPNKKYLLLQSSLRLL